MWSLSKSNVGPWQNAMPELYEDTLPSVVPMNRDYDMGYVNGQGQPLPDCTDPLPDGVTPPPAGPEEDDLVSAWLTLPNYAHGTWKMTVPAGFRVWQQLPCAWEEVESDQWYLDYFGTTMSLRIEGLSPSGTLDNYLIVSAQKTDGEGTPQGLPIEDRVKVEVVSIDLEIAEISELDEETQPAFVPINDDYDEQNTHGISGEAVTDNNRLHGQVVSVEPKIIPGDDDLVHAKLTLAGPADQPGKYWIEVLNEPQYAQYVLVWKSTGAPVPTDRASALPITLNAQAVDLLIEGLTEYYSQSTPIRLIAHFEPDGDYPAAGVEADLADAIMARGIDLELDADVDSKNDSGYATPDNNSEEDLIEQDSSTGKIVWASTGDIDGDGIIDSDDFDGVSGGHFVPMVLRLSENISEVNPSEITISITYDSNILRIWKPGKDASTIRTADDIITSGSSSIASSLGLFPGGSVVVFIEALQSHSSTLPIIINSTITGEDGSGTLTDKVHVAATEFKYVRVYDTHKVPNRSTRAVGVPEDVLQQTRLYEDNPRSDYDATTTPGIVFGGWGENMVDASITVEAEFDGPEWIGDFILWNISANNGCRVDDDTSGSFSSSKTIISSVAPSTAERRSHPERNDIVINVGVDANGNGILEGGEHSVPSFGNRLIGKAEYDYCYDSLTGWLNFFGGMWYTQAGELLEIFTDTDIVADYDSTRIVTQTYGGTHNQSNALGFDETVNITQGTVTEYTWNADSSFSSKVLADDDFFDQVIRPAVEGLKIDEFYDNNPSVLEHTFTVQINELVAFPDGDLHYSLKHATISFVLTIHTERGSTIPEITGVKGNGSCIDFYDFRTYGSDEDNGWASRVQACHSQNHRDAGEVFWVHIDLDVSEYFFWIDVYYNDLDGLKDKWQDIV